MTQTSYFHNGAMRGDSANAPYTAEMFHDVMRKIISSASTNGVIPSLTSLTELQVTSAGVDMEVDVASGNAFVEGIYYKSGATESFELDGLSGSGTRWDRIVVRVNWETQTARLTIIKGIEASTPILPELQQDFGTIYDFPLARVYINSSVLIQADYVFDERSFIKTAQAAPTINFMHNTQFVGGAKTGADTTALQAPAYWYTEGDPTITNVYVPYMNFDLFPSDIILEGNILDVTINTLGDKLKTDVLVSRASSTVYGTKDYSQFTLAFYIHVKTGSVAFYTNFGFGDILTATFRVTDEPVLYILRGVGYSTVDGFSMSFEGNPSNFWLYPVTIAYGLNLAPFHPKKENILFYGAAENDYTRSTSADNIILRYEEITSGPPLYAPRRYYPLIWQTAYDSGSAGADSIYAEVKYPDNALRTEVGRLPNDVSSHTVGLVNGGELNNYLYIYSDIVASGASTLEQELKWIGIFL